MVGLIFALIGFFLALLFIVYALLFLICVPNRLQEISFYMRKMVEMMEGKKFDLDPSDDDD